ncbi:hypothetical protein AQUCO_07600006v1 [Aquilegia coerulea]|uniref:Uncharacterized protein n=1 Tax=Aquilegia coerulea TaxID=218851 RepID=A0A2G5C8C6_AQUCA|nr:hypothetical protein AQUCO_07600006v1 [Aquilegia coerulea]
MAHITQANNPSRELNWLDLPNHVVLLITDKLITPVRDYIRFGAVCRSWRSIYTNNLHWYRTHLPPQLPLLLMLSPNDDVEHSFLYSLTENKLYNFPFVVPDDKDCCGSTQGWLVVTVYNSEIHLLNPWLTVNNEIKLPSIAAIDPRGKVKVEVYVEKVVLSVNPSLNSNYIVMAIYGAYSRLAFFKPGEKNWICFNTNYDMFEDVIYYQDQFYGINYYGELFICDVNPSNPMVSKFIERPLVHTYADKKYLVESNGSLLQILRNQENVCDSSGCTVLTLDPVECKWIETKNLSGRMLFLEEINVGDFKEPDGLYDMGVFNIEDGSFEPHYTKVPSTLFMPPIWVLPTL